MKREKMNLCGVSALLLLLLLVSSARAQNGPNNTGMDGYQYQNLSAATVVIIMVMIAVLLCLALFSFYFRHCFDFSESGAVRQLGASIRRRAAPRGLDHAVLETFPTFLYSEVKDKKIGKGALECAVCLNEFEEEDNLRLIPKCDHVFHPECIDAWLESHVTCPVCRANLAEPCDPVGTAESHPEPEENAVTPNREEVSIRISDEPEQEETLTVHPQQTDRIPSVNRSRPPRSRSARPKAWSRFPRSHTTGHSLVQPGENFDRFTLRLPQDLRKQMVSRALNRTASSVSGLPMESSERRGYRTGFGEGSARGGMSFKRSNTSARSGRRFSTMALPFLSRMLSLRSPRSPKVLAGDGEGSTTAKTPRGKTTLRLPSMKPLEPKQDETGSIAAGESSRPPV